MGVKFSQLPVASSVASDDYIAVLDTSENILKRTPISHASTATQYGIGGTSNYGHNKLLDGLTRTSYQEGEALASHQGNVLANDMGTFEPGARAAYAHAVGEYFMWVGQFVKVTAAIAAGDTIAIGTNVASTNVAAVLSELNSNIKYYSITKTTGNAGNIVLFPYEDTQIINIFELSNQYYNTCLFTYNGDYIVKVYDIRSGSNVVNEDVILEYITKS